MIIKMLKTSLKTRCREFELPRSNQNSAKLFSFAGILNSIKDITDEFAFSVGKATAFFNSLLNFVRPYRRSDFQRP